MKKVLSFVLALAMVLSMSACGQSGSASSQASGKKLPTIDSLKLGEDYKDIKADLKFLTNRTDIVNTKLPEYVKEFQKLYPNINVKYEAITNYADDVTTRMTTDDWGDVCSIPMTVAVSELSQHFLALGTVENISKTYRFATKQAYQGTCYGISSVGGVQGIVYNKKIFKDAGITTLPKTPDEYLADLKTIKTKTKAIPLYTNFAAKWTMSSWDDYISGCATGDPDFMNQKLAKMKDPFAKSSFAAGTGPYAVYDILYEAVKRKLIEDDPTTTDWESSKTKLNNGQIATMVLGSWAVNQIQGAGKNPDNVGYMPFPITVNGKQYATLDSDYCYGINKNSSDDNKIAAMLYVKWLTEKSNFAYNEGCVPVMKSAKLPDFLQSFTNIMLENTPAKTGEEDLFTKVNNDSELSIKIDNVHVSDIVEAALDGTKTLDDIVKEWNQKWTDAQQKNGIK